MQIELVRIRGFGAISNKEYRFLGGLNVIHGANEAGKSTIAEFIRAMFYGLESGVRDVRVNERLRYTPLSSGEMGGILEFSYLGRKYVVDRIFGKTKGADKLKVTDGTTGTELSVTPAEILGMNNDSYKKTLYIKQLSAKPELAKDDEILTRLINLSQTGSEQDSYQKAREILVDANKSLTSKQRGLIPQINANIAVLQAERAGQERVSEEGMYMDDEISNLAAEKDRLKSEVFQRSDERVYREKYSQWRMEKQQGALKLQVAKKARENERIMITNKISHQQDEKRNYIIFAVIAAILCIASIVTSFFIVPFVGVALITAIGAALFIRSCGKRNKRAAELENELADISDLDENMQIELLNEYENWFMEKLGTSDFDKIPMAIERYCDEYNMQRQKKNERIVELAEKIRDRENARKSAVTRPVVLIDQEIVMEQKKVYEYEEKAASIQRAIEALDKAYTDMEQDYAPRLNIETAKVLKEITRGKYINVRADGVYSLTLIDNSGCHTRSDYMSCGCYDQIYFSLRMGIINLLDIKAPIILDDALALYDDSRHSAVMDYISTIKNQVLLFTCQKRENAGNMITL